MAEWSNAHDSKSCDAGMYPWVQIPLSAPRNKRLVAILLQVFFYVFLPNTILESVSYTLDLW